MNLAALEQLVTRGESETLEFKRSTAELRQAGESLCAFLNGEGGQVVIGVAPEGGIVGQQVSDSTLRDVAAMLGCFEPAARVDRVGSTSSVMPQEEYGRLLLDRSHSRHRWENQPAVRVDIDDLDHEEILRTRQTAIEQRRLSAGTRMDVGDIIDRLGLRIDGRITQAAQMLYGTRFLPDYPQGQLKLGRFRGTTITGDILDNKQEHMHAFAMVREAIAWLDRTLPLAARFPRGSINREDRLPVPAAALREVILNAVMHRDYSRASSYVAIAVFDDRVEVRSVGDFPTGIHAEMLLGDHPSILRNPLIAGAFHRTGAVEAWGRGTNRVIEAGLAHGIAPPELSEQAGVVTVTFGAAVRPMGAEAPSRDQAGTKPGPSRDQAGTKPAPSRHQAGTKPARSRDQAGTKPAPSTSPGNRDSCAVASGAARARTWTNPQRPPHRPPRP